MHLRMLCEWYLSVGALISIISFGLGGLKLDLTVWLLDPLIDESLGFQCT